MKKLQILILLLTVCAVGCKKSFLLDVPDCDYNARIVVDYNQENTVNYNSMADYANIVDIYVFDASKTLCYTNRISEVDKRRLFVAKPTLAAGKYSVVALANKSELSALNEAVVGTTKLENILLTLSKTDRSDRLYYGYRSFSVMNNNVSDVRVDMVHSHCVINFRIRWKQEPPPMGDYYAMIKYVPSEYSLMPQYVYPKQSLCEVYDPTIHDEYLRLNRDVRHHIVTAHQDRNILDHKLHLRRTADEEIKGQFVTYRIKNQTTPTMVLYRGTDDSGKLEMKEINLQRYFQEQNINLDYTLKQEYAIDILIDGNNVYVMSMVISDWEEGGTIG